MSGVEDSNEERLFSGPTSSGAEEVSVKGIDPSTKYPPIVRNEENSSDEEEVNEDDDEEEEDEGDCYAPLGEDDNDGDDEGLDVVYILFVIRLG